MHTMTTEQWQDFVTGGPARSGCARPTGWHSNRSRSVVGGAGPAGRSWAVWAV